jgi:excisionase family DNA binding protein
MGLRSFQLSTYVEEEAETMPNLITIREASEMLKLSQRTLYKLIAKGEIKPIRVGRSLRVDSESLIDRSIVTDLRYPGYESRGPTLGASSRILANMGDEIKELESILNRQEKVLEEASQLSKVGIYAVHPPRRTGDTTPGAIKRALESGTQINLGGVALRAFFFADGRYHYWLCEKLEKAKTSKDMSVRAIMLYPLGKAAMARAFAEGGMKTAKKVDMAQPIKALKETNLFRDITRSIYAAEKLTNKFGDKLQVNFIDFHPTVFQVQTNETMFVEIYHLGMASIDIPGMLIGGCVGEQVPILQVMRGSNLYTLLDASFNHVWSGENPFLGLRTLKETCKELKKYDISV